MNEYFNNLNQNLEGTYLDKFNKLREYATEFNVPILKLDSINLLKYIIKLNNVKTILEVGTAIGYSSLEFATAADEVYVDTMERNEEMIALAKKNIADFNKTKYVHIIEGDALLLDDSNFKTYDLIFIDAAKAQYQKFFDKFEKFLNPNGIIVCDNLLFHGCVENIELASKNVRSMVKKIEAFNDFLKNNPNYDTIFLDSGDGLSISRRK